MKYKRFSIILALVIVGLGLIFLAKAYPVPASVFVSKISGGGTKLFPLISIAALIDSINPCAFSILLLTIAFLFSVGTFSRAKILQIGGAYIFGIFIAYLAIGLGLLGTLHLFNTPHFMGKLGATVLIGMGVINLINEFFPGFPIKLQIPKAAHSKIADLMEKTSLLAVFLLGGLVGLCEFPCTGGPYTMAIGLLHDHQTYYRGLVYLIWYNFLFVLPLGAVLFLASEQTLLEKLQSWKKSNLGGMKFISSVIMVALGVLIFFV